MAISSRSRFRFQPYGLPKASAPTAGSCPVRARRAASRSSPMIRTWVSPHRPIISDAWQRALEATPRGYALAFQWTALAEDDLTLQASLKLSQAHDWESFVAIGRNLHAPQQNVVYADVEGNIGFIAPGRVP